MKRSVILSAVGLVALLSASLLADHHLESKMPQHVHDAIGKLVGSWASTTTVDGKELEETIVAEWSEDGKTVVYHWNGFSYLSGRPQTGTGVIGWNSATNTVIEISISSMGEVWNANHYIGKDHSSWESPTTGFSLVDGKPVYFEETRTLAWASNDELSVTSANRYVDGKKAEGYTGTMKRQ